MKPNVLLAVFRRNFVSYFANPTGYLFICSFVILGTYSAFWVKEFFNNNLANLDQLSHSFPFIMLVFIPTITMGIWADERKQGTDELLLTIPARDFDIVLGKYLAAVGIYSVALLFSLICNYLVLNNLASSGSWALKPQLDIGLFVSTYIGYWLVGLAMLAIGAIASFLTNNTTIAFVLGVAFNVPLVFLAWGDTLLGGASRQIVVSVEQWSMAQRLADYARGMVTLTGLVYFAAIIAVMLYVSMVLIGQRHWFTGPKRWLLAGHYAVRTLALLVIAVGLVIILQNHDTRIDLTKKGLNSLSPQTYELIKNLKAERPVQIDAYISPVVPEAYVQTRLNLLTMLQELKALGGEHIQVEIHATEPSSSEAALAEKRWKIEPKTVTTLSNGVWTQDKLFLNVAMKCGTGNPVGPIFFDRGIPVEYELVRSLCTVSQQKRKKLGIVTTDAPLYGSFNMQSMSASPNWPIVEELEKQYEVVKVDPSKPITEKYDVLLAVQPSSLGPNETDNFVAAVTGGQPTAIFEDPAPMFSAAPATSAPRQPPGGMNPMFGGMQQPPPKGDISKLWRLLGVEFVSDQIIWQDYNPYTKVSYFNQTREFVFVDKGCGAAAPFNAADPASAGLQQVLFPFPGFITRLNSASDELHFTPLVKTSEKTGTVRYSDLIQMSPFGPRGGLNPNRRPMPTYTSYTLAAHIEGMVKADTKPDAAQEKDDAKSPAKKDAEQKARESKINVILVSDTDLLSPQIFQLREEGERPEVGINFNFDNVTFVLNALDELADDSRFVEVRNRRQEHRTLARIEERTKAAKQEATEKREKYMKDYEAEDKKLQQAMMEKIAELKKRKDIDPQQMLIDLALTQQDEQQKREHKIAQLTRDKDRSINETETELKSTVDTVQFEYKMWAVLLPPIPPLLLAIGVLLVRRVREREGVARSRLR